MTKEINTKIENIAAHFHETANNQEALDTQSKNSEEFKEIESIYNLREHVSFLSKQKPEEEIWRNTRLRIVPKRIFPVWLKYVAIIILSLSTGPLYVYFSSVGKSSNTFGTITCPKGQIASLTLFDSTKVWLNSESTIKYASDFNNNNREVYVDGEAYFEVTQNKKLPFVVNLKDSKVQVHGTHFNVKSYSESNDVEVVLLEGQVEFISGSSSVFMKPNEQIIFSSSERTYTKSQVDSDKISGWKDGKYFYTNESLETIVQEIQRWYGVDIVFENDEARNFTFTGLIDKNKSIGYNLHTIEMTKRINIQYRNDKIVIKGKEK